ncbi:MAG: sigma-54 dependent transcriptional regulator [Candidatus Wallbacteria bacterium]|nr:sigma-54 dependent transcriptional regulator [Candidatus Wallbacteria bacterium]
MSIHDKIKILVVDDALNTLEVIQRNLVLKGYQVFTASEVSKAIELLNSLEVNLVITDLKMPKSSGMDLIKHVRENFRNTEVMMITGYPSIKGAVEAIRYGADEYLPKPFTDEELYLAVERALKKLRLRQTAKSEEGTDNHYGLIGDSSQMKKVYSAITKTTSTNATVLITGESGTGKELVARAIHYHSLRSSAPFVPVNCGAIPEDLLESELFGYMKGAFTGASASRAGFFQTAEGGTIFLDEISETPLAMQVKLLRVLQEREVCMIGSSKPMKIDIRIIAATNKNLTSLMDSGKFREDLFYRLNVITIDLPPLRDRGDDILLLSSHLAERTCRELNKQVPVFSDGVLSALRSYYWPGNVRELENMILRMIVMKEGDKIDTTDLPPHMRFTHAREMGLDRTLAEVEAEYIRNVLESVDGNKTRASEILGISRKTLRDKLKLSGKD